MSIPSDLIEYVARQDTTLAGNQPRLTDLVYASLRYLENETDWRLENSASRTLYRSGGVYSILLPQPGTVTEVAIRYGTTWSVESSTLWTQLGEDGRDLVRVDNLSWPGVLSQLSFRRTPGLSYTSDGYGIGSGTHLGDTNIRIALTCGFNSATDWPQDLLLLLSKLVLQSYISAPHLRRKTPEPDAAGEVARSVFTPHDWRTLRNYKEGRPRAE